MTAKKVMGKAVGVVRDGATSERENGEVTLADYSWGGDAARRRNMLRSVVWLELTWC